MNQLLTVCGNPIFISSCLKDWEKFGKKNFLVKCKDGGLVQSVKLLLDLFIKLLNGEGKLDILSKLLPDLIKQLQDDNAFESKLLDVLWLLDSALADVNSEAVRDRYFRLLHLCKVHVNTALLMERLSEDTLENMSLIQSKQQFQTRYVRTKTRLFFKQQKFNLLREENEGYAKLITELSQTKGPMDAVMTQVRSLIGYFDLDPNRVLDLILDVSEFRENMSELLVKLIRLYNPDKLDLTHILGHKFHFTQEPSTVTPTSLFRVAAILLANGLVNLDVLYGHLYPSDADIQSARARVLSAAKSYRPAAPSNLSLANAAAMNTSLNSIIVSDLSRGDNPTGPSGLHPSPLFPTIVNQEQGLLGHGPTPWMSNSTIRSLEDNAPAEEKPPVIGSASNTNYESNEDKESESNADSLYENNQKLELCAALVRQGDWSNAQTILDRFTGYWATGHKSLNEAICEMLHYLIEPLYAKMCPLPSCLKRNRKRNFGSFAERTDAENPESANLLSPVHDLAKLARVVLPIAGYLGPNMSMDVVLMVKFCRIGCAYLSSQSTSSGTVEAIYQGFFNLLDEVLLPSLSLVDANCCLAEDIWQLLRFMPYDHRYRLYGQWKHMTCQNEPSVIRKRAQVLVRTKAILKRLSKENVKPMGRQLGKLSHSNPGLLFDNLLNTVQLYTNIIGPVVEALKYVSSLGYDVLAFCIIEALAADEAKLDDLQFSQGLQALSSFTGLLCKKYQFDLAGLMQYVLNQLKAGKSYDLLVLRELLHRMSGIDVIEEMTDEQVESMSGGELLLQEGGYYAQIRNTRKNATRLKEALMEHNMIMPFIFLMAQQRDAVLFLDDPERHVKLAGRLYDQCQGTLVQFITFLSLQLTREEMQTQCLPIERMMGEFHVPADTAFCLHRSVFEQKVARLFESKERAEGLKSGEKSKSSSKALFAAVSQQICAEIARAIRPLYPSRVWDELGTNFFVTFWSLQSSDLVVPEAAYQRQIQQLREQINQIDAAVNGWTSAKKKREVDRLQGLISRLSAEQAERLEHVSHVRAWLLAERDTWFQTRLVTKTDTITQFLQLCIYPRVCYTTADAIYAAQFMHVLHQLKTSRFSTLICLDRIFNDITLPTSMCTEDEAHRYGRFLCAVLELVMRWHASEEIFNQECGQFPGFVTVFRKGSDANTKADQLQYENYRHVVHKWHYRITKATVACLESGNYVQIRNALIVLTRILPQYPRIIQFGSAVERRVHKLKEEEKDRRPDLKALAFSYAGLIRLRKSKWVSEEDFHLKENKSLRTESTSSLNNNTTAYVSAPTHHPVRVPMNTDGSSQSVANRASTVVHGSATNLANGAHISNALENSPNVSVTKRSSGYPATQRTSALVNDSRGRPSQPAFNPSLEPVAKSSSTLGSTQASGQLRGQASPNKQRSIHRVDAAIPIQSCDSGANSGSTTTTAAPTATVDEGQGSKRRRVDPNAAGGVNSASLGNTAITTASITTTTSTTAVAAAKGGSTQSSSTDEAHDARKLARKRSIPSASVGAETTSITSDSSARQLSRCESSSASSRRSASGDRMPSGSSVSTGQSRHQSRHGHRASSSNSADSKDDDERSHSSSGKKMKRAHHHHHRHSTESTGVSPLNVQYSPARTVTAADNPSSASLSSSSRHNRK